MKRPHIPPPPRAPSARAHELVFGFVPRERQLVAMWTVFGVAGLLVLAFGTASALSDDGAALVLVYAALALPFVATAVRGVRRLRKDRKHRQDAFVHGVPTRARITMRSHDPPALWWDFEVDGVRYAGAMMLERVADLPAPVDAATVWVLYHPKKPRRSVLWLE
jgi:hypothetical protein